jgi:hypothetical protein
LAEDLATTIRAADAVLFVTVRSAAHACNITGACR